MASARSFSFLFLIASVTIAFAQQNYNDGREVTKNADIGHINNGFHGDNGGIVGAGDINGGNGAVYNNNGKSIVGFHGSVAGSQGLNNGYQGNSFISGSFHGKHASAPKYVISNQRGIDGTGKLDINGVNSFKDNGIVGQNSFHGNNGIVGQNGFHGNNGIVGQNSFHGNNGIVGQNGFHGNNGIVGQNGFHGNNGIVGQNGFHGKNGIVGQNGFHGNNGIVDQNGFHGNNGIDGQNGFHGNNGIVGQNSFHGNNGNKINSISGSNFHENIGINSGNGYQGNNGITSNNFHDNNGFDGDNVYHGNNGIVGHNFHGNNGIHSSSKDRIVGNFVQHPNGIVGNFGKNNGLIQGNVQGNDYSGDNGLRAQHGIAGNFRGIGDSSNQFSRNIIRSQMPGRGFGKSVHSGINNGINQGLKSNIGGQFNNGLKGGNFVNSNKNGFAGSVNGRINGGLNNQHLSNIHGPINIANRNGYVGNTNFNNGQGSIGKMNLNGQHANVGFGSHDAFESPAFDNRNSFGSFSNDKFGSGFNQHQTVPLNTGILGNNGLVGQKVANNGLIGNKLHGNNNIPIQKGQNFRNQNRVNQRNIKFNTPATKRFQPIGRTNQFKNGNQNIQGGRGNRHIYQDGLLNNGVQNFNSGVVSNVGSKPFIQEATGISGLKTRDVIGEESNGILDKVQQY